MQDRQFIRASARTLNSQKRTAWAWRRGELRGMEPTPGEIDIFDQFVGRCEVLSEAYKLDEAAIAMVFLTACEVMHEEMTRPVTSSPNEATVALNYGLSALGLPDDRSGRIMTLVAEMARDRGLK